MNPQPKPARGTHVIDRETKRYQIELAERDAKGLARKRDSYCRWPEKHTCRGVIEVAHIFHDKGMGGDHGLVSKTWNLMTLCAWMHRLGPASIHGKQVRVEPETPYGADKACSFWRLDEHGEWVCVGVEVRIGVLRKV
jgi:hypothetical protein